MTTYSNGRPTFSGAEVINAINPQKNRTIVIPCGSSYAPIEPTRQYDLAQLLGRSGMPAVVDIPRREKGGC